MPLMTFAPQLLAAANGIWGFVAVAVATLLIGAIFLCGGVKLFITISRRRIIVWVEFARRWMGTGGRSS